MLILSRRIGEKLIIGENVTVTILAVKGNQVRVGIDAPRDVRVDREEIHQRILEEEKAMSRSDWTKAKEQSRAEKAPDSPVKTTYRTLSLSAKR